MRRSRWGRTVMALAAALLPLAAAADLGVTGKLGTMGVGLDLSLRAAERMNVRLAGHWLELSAERSYSEGDIDADLELSSLGALLDWYPGDTAFRISAGAFVNNNNFVLDADPSQPVTLSGFDFNLDEFSGEVTFNDLAPYIGIGYGNALGADQSWHIAFDLGVLFQGEPQVDATAVSSVPVIQPIVDIALELERRSIERDLENYQFFPVVTLGVSYRF